MPYPPDGGSPFVASNWALQGIEDYNDSGTSQALTNGSFVDLTNDGAGVFTNLTYKLPVSNNIWDTVNNEFNWLSGGLTLGDTVDIRFDLLVTTGSPNTDVAFRLDMANGTAGEYPLEIDRRQLKVAGADQIVRFSSIYMGDLSTLNNPAKISMFVDSTGSSVVVNGWYIRTVPRNLVTI